MATSIPDIPAPATNLSNGVVRRVPFGAHALDRRVGPRSVPYEPDRSLTWNHEDLVANRVYVRKGEVLFHRGTPFTAVYAVRSGCCKSVLTTAGGQEQIAAFHIAGEVVGVEAIDARAYDATVIALEDSEFGAIPCERLDLLARDNGEVQRGLRALLSRELRRCRTVAFWLGAMRADQRLASFLLDLADRYAACGYSSRELLLRMTRQEIGIHLGLSHETVSRLLSNFDRQDLVRVSGRKLIILDRRGLEIL